MNVIRLLDDAQTASSLETCWRREEMSGWEGGHGEKGGSEWDRWAASPGSEGWLASRSSSLTEAAHLRQGYGGQPSPAFMSEGWWRRRELNSREANWLTH